MNLDKIAPYAKAIIGFLAPALTALVAAVQEGSQNGTSISGPEWVGIIAAAVITGGAVFTVPNKGATPPPIVVDAPTEPVVVDGPPAQP